MDNQIHNTLVNLVITDYETKYDLIKNICSTYANFSLGADEYLCSYYEDKHNYTVGQIIEEIKKWTEYSSLDAMNYKCNECYYYKIKGYMCSSDGKIQTVESVVKNMREYYKYEVICMPGDRYLVLETKDYVNR